MKISQSALVFYNRLSPPARTCGYVPNRTGDVMLPARNTLIKRLKKTTAVFFEFIFRIKRFIKHFFKWSVCMFAKK
jgi:hypothetical protein